MATVPLVFNRLEYTEEKKTNTTKNGKEVIFSDKVIYEEVLNQLNTDKVQEEKELDNVTEIIIYNKNIVYPQELSYLKNVKRLILVNCNIKDISFVTNMNNLELLDVRNNSELVDISSVAYLGKLSYLNISNTGVWDVSSVTNVMTIEK